MPLTSEAVRALRCYRARGSLERALERMAAAFRRFSEAIDRCGPPRESVKPPKGIEADQDSYRVV